MTAVIIPIGGEINFNINADKEYHKNAILTVPNPIFSLRLFVNKAMSSKGLVILEYNSAKHSANCYMSLVIL